MPYIVTVDQPNLAPDAEIFIHGLGTFFNGKPAEVSDEQAELFRRTNSEVDVEYGQDGSMTHTGRLGKSIEEAAESMYGVTVTKVTGSDNTPKTVNLTPDTTAPEQGTDSTPSGTTPETKTKTEGGESE